MPITPDTKNWTWVLERRCPECGFDASTVPFRKVPQLTRDAVEAWQHVLERQNLDVRPDDSTWSPLEYAAHVRDVFRTMHGRLDLMLTRDDPELADWDQDRTAVEDRYNEQDPAEVSVRLATEGRDIADAFEAVRDDQLDRRGRRSDGAVFTVETLARYFVHDPVHHLWDVTGAGA